MLSLMIVSLPSVEGPKNIFLVDIVTMDIGPPKLIEPTVKYYMDNILQSCHNNRTQIYYYTLNISVLVLFIIIVCVTLYYCRSQKKTPYELQQKLIRDQNYVLSKIRYYQDEQKKITTTRL
jgi:hypothetical protein